ncbi:MAG: DUF4340 domain-containing protein [Myxococcaceae bacterium]|nr:DUF4340 domain-containing protein [Myxococcaceae bacterium]
MKKTTLLALALFGALLAVVMLTREDETNLNVGVPKLTVPALNGDPTVVEVSGANAAKLTSENGLWKVNGFAADEAQVKSFTDALKDFKAQDFVTEKAERHAELEVDDVKGTKVTVSTAAGPRWTLVFGKAGKSGGTYVRDAKSNAVFTTNSPVAYQLKRKANDWRKKMITTALMADVTKVTVTQPSGVLTLVRKDDGWKLEPPPPADFRFDAEAPTRLLGAATMLQAQDFGDSLGEQVATLDLELKDGKKLQLKLGAKRPEGTTPLQVEGDPQVYLLAQFTADQLLKTTEDMRDTTLLAFDPAKVKTFTITAAGKTIALQKEGEGWKVTEPKKLPDGYEVDVATVSAALNRLKLMKASQLAPDGVTDAAAGLTKPTAVVEVQLEGGAKQAMRFGGDTPAKDRHYVKGTADNRLYVIGTAQRASYEGGLDMFKKRPPPDMSQMRGLEQLPPEVRRQLEAQLKMQQQ